MRSARAEPSGAQRSAQSSAPLVVGPANEDLQPIGTTFVVVENRSDQPPDGPASVRARTPVVTQITHGEDRTNPLSAQVATAVIVVLVAAGAIGLAWRRRRVLS